jgi:putative ABC transport system permease protein
MLDLMMFDQFEKVQLYNIKINFDLPAPATEAVQVVNRQPGALRSEPVLELPVTLRNAHITLETMLTGYEEDTELYQILDKGTRPVPMPKEGVVLSKWAAGKLGVGKGDVIEAESAYSGDTVRLIVADVAEQYLAMGCFVSRGTLCRLFHTGDIATSVVSRISGSTAAVEKTFNFTPGVSSVENNATTLQMYNDLMEPMMASVYTMALIAVFIAFAIIYNSGVISMAERQRELSSARILGMTPGEVLRILLVEQAVVSGIGCALGLPLCSAMMRAMAEQYETEMYAMPSSMSPTAWAWALLCVALALLLSGAAVYRKIRGLDLVSVLKERD